MSIKDNLKHIINEESAEITTTYINRIIVEGKNYGRSNYGDGKKVNIRCTLSSEVLNVENLSMFVYSDCLSHIMSFAGYDVTRELYVKINNNAAATRKILDKIRVNFDMFTEEKFLYDNGLVDAILSRLQKSGKCYINDNGLWLKTVDLNDSENRLLIDENGSYACLLPEIAYYVDKFTKGYDVMINISNCGQCKYVEGIKAGIEFAGYSSDKIVFKNLNENYENIYIDELINKLSVNDIRYYLINALNNVNNLNLFTIKNINNSLYYIENAYAKICLLLRENKCEIMDKCGSIDSDCAYTILNKLIEFDKIVVSASNENIGIVFDYLYELAKLFYKYEDEVINDDNDNYLNEKCFVLSAIRIVMNNAANMLGLILREEI